LDFEPGIEPCLKPALEVMDAGQAAVVHLRRELRALVAFFVDEDQRFAFL